MDFAKEFEKLMKTHCEIYSNAQVQNDDGTYAASDTLKYSTVCNYHSLSVDNAQFADKIGTKTAIVCCLPLWLAIALDDRLMIEGSRYDIVGIRLASNRIQNIVEAVLYE